MVELAVSTYFHFASFVAQPGVSQAQLVRNLQAVLPAGLEAVTGQQAASDARSDILNAMGQFNTLLLVFAVAALLVGAFMIFNTFSITVAQRTREFAMLRMVGAARRQVLGSVHWSREELAEMIRLTRPQLFVPIHGEYRHLKRHMDVAIECGVPAHRCFLLQDGESLAIEPDGARRGAKVQSGRTLWDGQALEAEDLLFERQALARSGTVAAMVVIDQRRGEILAGPDLISRGFISGNGSSEHLNRAREELRRSLEERLAGHRRQGRELKEEVVRALRAYFAEEVGRTPVILPWVVEL